MSGHNMAVTFLGTTSGGGPTDTRSCSSLVLDALGDSSLWMVDCAEGTLRQFALQPEHTNAYHRLRVANVKKIFITHMHADHTMGIITLLRNLLGFAPDASQPVKKPPVLKVELYGPVGLRAFVRTVMTLTHTRGADLYCVHELLGPGERPSAPSFASDAASMLGTASGGEGEVGSGLHPNERPGLDFMCDADGCWRDMTAANVHHGGASARVTVHAGPIIHRDPCIGYLFAENTLPPPSQLSQHPLAQARKSRTYAPRTILILGDTSDPSPILPVLQTIPSPSPPSPSSSALERPTQTLSVSLLIHECTSAFIPPHIDTRGTSGNKNRTLASVEAKAITNGHSTPGMAGTFANLVGAESLVLNHLGSRYHPAASPWSFRTACIREIERQATQAWQPAIPGASARAVADFDRVVVLAKELGAELDSEEGEEVGEEWEMREEWGVQDDEHASQSASVSTTSLIGEKRSRSTGGELESTGPSERGRGRGTGTGRGRARGRGQERGRGIGQERGRGRGQERGRGRGQERGRGRGRGWVRGRGWSQSLATDETW